MCFFSFYITLQPEGEDDLKKRQLMELAIINGTYRDTKSQQSPSGTPTATATATSIAQATRKLVTAVHQVVRVLNPLACCLLNILYQRLHLFSFHSYGSCCDDTYYPTYLGFIYLVCLHFSSVPFTKPQLPHYSFYLTICHDLMSSRLSV